jgi:SAM-dependent methyltransferase
MKYRLMQWLACPRCRSTDLALETSETRVVAVTHGHFTPDEGAPAGVDLDRGEETDVVTGALHCGGCAAVYQIRDGIPRLLSDDALEGPATAHRWTTFDSAHPEWEESFLDYASPLQPKDFLGRLVLDAGCGYGRHAYFAARYGAEVIAIDSSGDAVAATAANTDGLSRVHVIQGSLLNPPIRDQLVDLAYCFGVLHHLEHPQSAFEALGDVVRPGGQLAVWVYGHRQGVTLLASNALRGMTTAMQPEELHTMSQMIARGLRLFSHTPYKLLGGVPVAGEVVRRLPVHDHHRWPFDVVVADIFDRLRIPIRHWFNREQLEVMLTDAGYADVRVSRRVRNNESFRAIGTRR